MGRLRQGLVAVEHALNGALRAARAPRSFLPLLREARRRAAAPEMELRESAVAAPTGGSVILLPALPWEYRRQRPQQMARAFAELGHGVLYADCWLRTRLALPPGIRVLGSRLGILSMSLAGRPDPFQGSMTEEHVACASEAISRFLRVPPVAILVQIPFWAPLATSLAQRYEVPLVYDRLDLHAAFPGAPGFVGRDEAQLMERADGVLFSSTELRPDPAPGRVDALVANGVCLEDFPSRHWQPRERTVVGYVGALSPWFDSEAVAHAAVQLPSWRFRVAGRVEANHVEALRSHANVELDGELPYPDVAALLREADLGAIPFRDLALTRAVDPVKLYEYAATGLPIVARDLPSLRRWDPPFLYRYRSPQEFVEQLVLARGEDSAEHVDSRRGLVASETWRARARQVMEIVETCKAARDPTRSRAGSSAAFAAPAARGVSAR